VAFDQPGALFQQHLAVRVPSQPYLAVAAGGFYVMGAPLPSGKHATAFGGTSGNGFEQDVTYQFTIS
jgi:hypothetical protein